MSTEPNINNLKNEESLHLGQHVNGPINWIKYGPAALKKAKDENKPIFISIGQSTCNWCQQMAAEAFHDKDIAEAVNKDFIAIKVDRDEYPDLDNYLQLACQVMNGQGGWPLNAFLTPQMEPYFIGTYFPATANSEEPSFKEVVENLAIAFKDDQKTILENSKNIIKAISQAPIAETKVEFQGHYPQADSILNALKNYQDNDNGGYGVEPKFPLFSFLEWSVEHMLEGMVSEEFGKHIIKTIENMLMSGMYDHVRGGIHRFSKDKEWKKPNFEKTLYDQAGLLRVLSKVSLIYPSPLVFDSLIQTLDYLQNEMLSEEGFFHSSQSGFSEGVEGLYFSFTKDEFLDALIQHDETMMEHSEKYLKWFNISENGNSDHNLNIISLDSDFKEEFYGPEGWNEVRKVKEALLEARKLRIPPLTDGKGIAAWNFQLCSALLDTIQYCKIDVIVQAALELLAKSNQSVHQTFIIPREEKHFIQTSTTRKRGIPLFEDYVFYAEYSFRNYELSGMPNYLENARGTIDFIFEHFHQDGNFLTRSTQYNDNEEYKNIHTPIFDQAYKSSLSTLNLLIRKWSTHIPEFKELREKVKDLDETLTHLSLQNPLGFGETLRAKTYPDEAYRKVLLPHSWLRESKIQATLMNFSSRFAIVYHNDENENWEISTVSEVEVKGSSLEEFKQIFQAEAE